MRTPSFPGSKACWLESARLQEQDGSGTLGREIQHEAETRVLHLEAEIGPGTAYPAKRNLNVDSVTQRGVCATKSTHDCSPLSLAVSMSPSNKLPFVPLPGRLKTSVASCPTPREVQQLLFSFLLDTKTEKQNNTKQQQQQQKPSCPGFLLPQI